MANLPHPDDPCQWEIPSVEFVKTHMGQDIFFDGEFYFVENMVCKYGRNQDIADRRLEELECLIEELRDEI